MSMNWDEARPDVVRFFRGLLGSGYIDDYYEAPADELIEILKMVESQSTSQPTTAEDETPTRAEIAELLNAHAQLLRSFADRLK